MPKYVTDDNPLEPKSEMLKIVNLEYIEKNYPHERQSIVDGLIRTGSVMNIIAAPKVGKSFIASNLAMCLITGSDFLGFPIARQGKTLVVDNELHLETLSYRYRATRTAMNVPEDQRHMIDILSLRGIPCDIPMLQKHVGGTRPGHYSAIILDAFYKLIPSGISENDNKTVYIGDAAVTVAGGFEIVKNAVVPVKIANGDKVSSRGRSLSRRASPRRSWLGIGGLRQGVASACPCRI